MRNGTILVDKCCIGRAVNVEIFIAGFVADKLHRCSLPLADTHKLTRAKTHGAEDGSTLGALVHFFITVSLSVMLTKLHLSQTRKYLGNQNPRRISIQRLNFDI